MKLNENFENCVEVVPVITFEYGGIEELKASLANSDSFSGIVFTSPRAVKAIQKTVIWGIFKQLNIPYFNYNYLF